MAHTLDAQSTTVPGVIASPRACLQRQSTRDNSRTARHGPWPAGTPRRRELPRPSAMPCALPSSSPPLQSPCRATITLVSIPRTLATVRTHALPLRDLGTPAPSTTAAPPTATPQCYKRGTPPTDLSTPFASTHHHTTPRHFNSTQSSPEAVNCKVAAAAGYTEQGGAEATPGSAAATRGILVLDNVAAHPPGDRRSPQRLRPPRSRRSEGKIFVAKNGSFLEKEFLTKEVTGRKVELDEVTEPSLIDQSSAVPNDVPVQPIPIREEENDDDHETSNEEATEPRRSTRERTTPDWYDPCLNVMIVDNNDEDPATYEEAMMSPDSNKWQEAMKSEMGSIYDNQVWTLVDLPDSRKAVENKWIFKRKTDADGNITVYKARLVAKGSDKFKELTTMRLSHL
ncbi:hypothetical protein QYE76_019438 [Lolium multiflorum]|uniref:Reverse transcriptase Ty1/copia-type domain-containing protein n=1 Tax=Lolium multiflorum TaxID=4521 RepID=A0AAD8R3Z1_LOLMU|nr:hypothetical protein QYE76_019438 [Lolium multiflorum]